MYETQTSWPRMHFPLWFRLRSFIEIVCSPTRFTHLGPIAFTHGRAQPRFLLFSLLFSLQTLSHHVVATSRTCRI